MSNIINVLYSSDCIIDKDIGILKLVQFNYRNKPEILINDILDIATLEIQQYLEYTRQYENPMSVFIKYDYWSQIDEWYSDLIKYDHNSIVKFSCNTEVINIIKRSSLYETPVQNTIICESEYEANIILKRLPKERKNVQIFIEKDWSKIDIGKYTSIYIKYLSNLEKFKRVSEKNIYISNHSLNMLKEDNTIFKPIVVKYMTDNIVKNFSLYNFDKEKPIIVG